MIDLKNTTVGTIIEKPLEQDETKNSAVYAARFFIERGIPFLMLPDGDGMNIVFPARWEGDLNAALLLA